MEKTITEITTRPSKAALGNLHQLASKTTLPQHRLRELAAVHGPVMHLRLGEVSTVVVSSADAAREVMKTHDAQMANRPRLMVGRDLCYDYSDIALAPYGEYWRQIRKIATLELFTAKRVDSFRPVREEEVGRLVESISSKAAAGAVVMNLSDMLFGLVFDITSRVVFNKKGEDQEAFRALVSDMSKVYSGFSIADLYPSIKFLYSIGGMKKKIMKMIEESNRILDPLIAEHKSNMKQGKTEQDLVDVLLKSHKDDPQNTNFSLTINNIKAIILEIFGAGSESSSTVVEWAMSELLRNPKTMEKAQNEVRQVYQGRGRVDETCLDKLKFLKMVIKEALRLHPPFPLVFPRECIERCDIHGYDIPPKTRVIVNGCAIGRDPKYWSEPTVFSPERFEAVSTDYKGTNFEFTPFGAGRRMCPGMTLGMANVELPLAMLLYHFNWKLPAGVRPEDLNMDESFGLVVRRKNGLSVIPTQYVSA